MSVSSHLNDDEQFDEDFLDSDNFDVVAGNGSSWYDDDGAKANKSDSEESSRWINKHNRYYYSGKGFGKETTSKRKAWKNLCVFVLSVLILASAVCSVSYIKSFYRAGDKMDEYVEKYNGYQQLCEQAYGNPEYLTTATVTDVYFNINANKYYLKYEIIYDVSYFLVGYTDAIYTYSEAMALEDTTIDVALDCTNANIDSHTIAITMDYYQMGKTRDGIYTNNIALRDLYIKKAIIAISAGVIFIVWLMLLLTKRKKKLNKVEETKTQQEKTETTNEIVTEELEKDLNLQINLDLTANSLDITNATEEPVKTSKWFCEFCETFNKDEADKCESCGARRPITR